MTLIKNQKDAPLSNQKSSEWEKEKRFLRFLLAKTKLAESYALTLTVREVGLSQLIKRFDELKIQNDREATKEFLTVLISLDLERNLTTKHMGNFFSERRGCTPDAIAKVRSIGQLLTWKELDHIHLNELDENPRPINTEEKLKGIEQLFHLQYKIFSLQHDALSESFQELDQIASRYNENLGLLQRSVTGIGKRGRGRRKQFEVNRSIFAPITDFQMAFSSLQRIYRIQGAQHLQQLEILAQSAPQNGLKLTGFFQAHRSYCSNLVSSLDRIRGLLKENRTSIFEFPIADLSPKETGVPLPDKHELRGQLRQLMEATQELTQALEEAQATFKGMTISKGENDTIDIKLTVGPGAGVIETELRRLGITDSQLQLMKHFHKEAYIGHYKAETLATVCSQATAHLGSINTLEALWNTYKEETKVEEKPEDFLDFLYELDEPAPAVFKRKYQPKKPIPVVKRKVQKVEPLETMTLAAARLIVEQQSRAQVELFWGESEERLQNSSGSFEGVCFGEMAYHAKLLHQGFSHYVDAILSNKGYRIAQIVPMLLLDLHVITEQDFKQKLLQSKQPYSRHHDLSALAAKLTGKLLPHRAISNGLCWARYAPAYLSVVPESRRPEGLKWMACADALLETYMEGGSISEELKERLSDMNSQLFAHLAAFYPKEALEVIKEEIEKRGFGSTYPQRKSDLPRSTNQPIPYQTARHHLARLEIAREMKGEGGWMYRNIMTHAMYGTEQLFALGVLKKDLGEHRGHDLAKFCEMLGEKIDVNDINLGKWLHYPTYCSYVQPHPVGQAISDATMRGYLSAEERKIVAKATEKAIRAKQYALKYAEK